MPANGGTVRRQWRYIVIVTRFGSELRDTWDLERGPKTPNTFSYNCPVERTDNETTNEKQSYEEHNGITPCADIRCSDSQLQYHVSLLHTSYEREKPYLYIQYTRVGAYNFYKILNFFPFFISFFYFGIINSPLILNAPTFAIASLARGQMHLSPQHRITLYRSILIVGVY